MFVVSLNYIKHLKDVNAYLGDHRTYLEKYYKLGRFIISGPREPRTGGIILVDVDSREQLNDIISEDPFFKAGVAEYEIIEFTPTMRVSGF